MTGALGGFYESKSQTERQIIEHLHSLYFGEKTLKTGVPVSGFVFYPEGSYSGVRVVLIESSTGRATEIAGPMVPRPE